MVVKEKNTFYNNTIELENNEYIHSPIWTTGVNYREGTELGKVCIPPKYRRAG
jgi:hypothetical protein